MNWWEADRKEWRTRRNIIMDALQSCGPFPSVLEIGVNLGGMFGDIKEFLEKHNGHWTGVDVVCKCSHITSSHATFILMSSLDFWKQLSPETKYGLIFIDGNHTYEYAYPDIKNGLEHLSQWKGFLLAHDIISCPGVRKAWNELRALNEKLLWVELPHHKEGMGVVKYK